MLICYQNSWLSGYCQNWKHLREEKRRRKYWIQLCLCFRETNSCEVLAIPVHVRTNQSTNVHVTVRPAEISSHINVTVKSKERQFSYSCTSVPTKLTSTHQANVKTIRNDWDLQCHMTISISEFKDIQTFMGLVRYCEYDILIYDHVATVVTHILDF